MPYVDKATRLDLKDKFVDNGRSIQNAGELNYFITKVVDEYIISHGKNYQILNEVIGVLECAKLELYRRVVSPYEDEKIQLNGDVYEFR